MITLEDWALIRRLAAEGVPKARIAARLGISRTTVIKAVASEAPPRYVRKPAETSFVVFEPRVRALLTEFPDMPATVIAERVGWPGSIGEMDWGVTGWRPGVLAAPSTEMQLIPVGMVLTNCTPRRSSAPSDQ